MATPTPPIDMDNNSVAYKLSLALEALEKMRASQEQQMTAAAQRFDQLNSKVKVLQKRLHDQERQGVTLFGHVDAAKLACMRLRQLGQRIKTAERVLWACGAFEKPIPHSVRHKIHLAMGKLDKRIELLEVEKGAAATAGVSGKKTSRQMVKQLSCIRREQGRQMRKIKQVSKLCLDSWMCHISNVSPATPKLTNGFL